MVKDPDIYKPSEPRKEDKPTFAPVDLTPQEARALVWRKTIVSLSVVLLVLLMATWIFTWYEQRSDREDLADLTPEQLEALLPPRTERSPVALPSLPDELPSIEMDQDPARGMDPERVAEAMGLIRMAERYAREQEWDRAESHARRALAIWPDMNMALRTLGFVYTQRGQMEQAVRVLSRALEVDPFNPETYNTLAAALMQQGEMLRAEELLQTSLRIRPDYIHASVNLGMLYLALGRYELAADYFEQVLESQPEHTTVRNNLGVCLLRIGRFPEARAHFHHLIQQHPQVAAWYFNMAITYTEQRDFATALEWIERGAQFCSPIEFERLMADSDFAELRQRPEYQTFRERIFPQLPDAFGG